MNLFLRQKPELSDIDETNFNKRMKEIEEKRQHHRVLLMEEANLEVAASIDTSPQSIVKGTDSKIEKKETLVSEDSR